eukprot:TRINITY_DN49521_c0_g1_i1.p1 TRINITY_DN49521_c0_g1~~TRINITY_DN49521_c0_g1_i1.p1  ORF type:complete len:388 (-),score=67.15 TRINITY_DN49521_c0_g1_i1:218-1381(-)
MAAAVFGTAELERRVLVCLGPRAALLRRNVCRDWDRCWQFDNVAHVARSGAWALVADASRSVSGCASNGAVDVSSSTAAAVEGPSLHELLKPFSRRTLSFGSRCHSGSVNATGAHASHASAADTDDSAPGKRLFDVVFVLMARRPMAAEEKAVADNMGRSPLIVAARYGLVEIAWVIASCCKADGAGLNQKDELGCSALRYAIIRKDARMCRCLLGFPAIDLEVRDSRGDTALLQAVNANAPGIILMLLERSADIAFASRGQTALDLAETLGYDACAARLSEQGAPRGCGQLRGEEAPLSESDVDLGGSESDPDFEFLEAKRESRRKTSFSNAKRKYCGPPATATSASAAAEDWCLSDEEELTQERQSQRRRWDSGDDGTLNILLGG